MSQLVRQESHHEELFVWIFSDLSLSRIRIWWWILRYHAPARTSSTSIFLWTQRSLFKSHLACRNWEISFWQYSWLFLLNNCSCSLPLMWWQYQFRFFCRRQYYLWTMNTLIMSSLWLLIELNWFPFAFFWLYPDLSGSIEHLFWYRRHIFDNFFYYFFGYVFNHFFYYPFWLNYIWVS